LYLSPIVGLPVHGQHDQKMNDSFYIRLMDRVTSIYILFKLFHNINGGYFVLAFVSERVRVVPVSAVGPGV